MRTVLNNELVKLKEKASAESFTELTKDLHFYPDLHGGPRRVCISKTEVRQLQGIDLPLPTLACEGHWLD